MPRLEVNGAELYYEVRGGGPPVLLIMGFTGDAGHFETLAGALASEFTVISYDRRGNGRSPRPPGWAATRPEEQADDAASLLAVLGLSPAAVFGTSAGANFALCLLIRHPETVSGAVLHETALVRLFDDPGARGGLGARPGSHGDRRHAGGARSTLAVCGGRSQLGASPARPTGAHAVHCRDLLRGRARELRGLPAR